MDTRADFITRKEFSILKKRYGLLEAHLDKWDIIGEFIANGIRNTRDVERLTIRAMFVGFGYDQKREIDICDEIKRWYRARVRADRSKCYKYYDIMKETYEDARKHRENALKLVLKYWQYLDKQRDKENGYAEA
jgi:hypothetical protein